MFGFNKNKNKNNDTTSFAFDQHQDDQQVFNVNGKNSGKPWVNVVGEDDTDDKGIKITMDWNDEFIAHLRSNGYQGNSDEVLIGKWLGDLERELNPIMEGNNESDFA